MMLPVALVAQLALSCAPEAAPGTLAAVAAAESGFDPLAIYDNTTGEVWRPRSRSGAVALARDLIGAGHTVDLGLMQVDSGNLERLRLGVAEAFDPCASLAAGARVLADGYEPALRAFSPRTWSVGKAGGGGATHLAQQAALRVAFSRYNTGSPTAGFFNGYVSRVLAAAQRVVPEIDLQPAAPERPKPAAAPGNPKPPAAPTRSWQVFGSAGKAAQSNSSSWNVFPQSVGPDRLAKPPAAPPAGDPSPAGMSVGGSGGTHDRKSRATRPSA
jgi:type IV secretion system protein VirB1